MSLFNNFLHGDGHGTPWDFSPGTHTPATDSTIGSGIARMFRSQQGPGQSKAAYDLIPIGTAGKPKKPDQDISNLLAIYQANALVYAAINRKATAAIGPRLLVKKKGKKDKYEEILGHPFRRLIMRPNPHMTESDFMEAYIVSLDVAGVFYVEVVRDKGTKLPIALYPLNPSLMSPILGEGNVVTGYQFKQGSQKIELTPEQVIVKYRYNPADRFKPISPLSVCLADIDADNAQTDFIRNYFQNAGIPSGLLKIARKITTEDAQSIKLNWRLNFTRNFGNQHDIAVLGDNADFVKIGTGLNEIQADPIRYFTESRITMAFGVPPLIIYAYVGLARANYANLKEAWRGFWDADLIPYFTKYTEWLTWNLLTLFVDEEQIYGEQVILDFDTEGVKWLAEDEDALQQRARDNFRAGGTTLNEFREAINEEADDGAGDYYYRPKIFVASAFGEPPEEPVAVTPDTQVTGQPNAVGVPVQATTAPPVPPEEPSEVLAEAAGKSHNGNGHRNEALIASIRQSRGLR